MNGDVLTVTRFVDLKVTAQKGASKYSGGEALWLTQTRAMLFCFCFYTGFSLVIYKF